MTANDKSGGEEDHAPRVCLDPGHKAPDMLYVPPGKVYRHVCPTCGYTVRLRSSDPSFKEFR